MKRYIAFLRGVNVSGKNKVAMAELKKCFEGLGFEDVKSYLNSGNVIFSSENDNPKDFTYIIKTMILNKFDIDIPIFIISKEDLEDILRNAPDWWDSGNKEIYDNLILIIPPTEFTDVFNEIGEPKEDLEKIANYKEAVFWSFSRKNYQKTNWWSKTASSRISTNLTIRTANTVKKTVEM